MNQFVRWTNNRDVVCWSEAVDEDEVVSHYSKQWSGDWRWHKLRWKNSMVVSNWLESKKNIILGQWSANWNLNCNHSFCFASNYIWRIGVWRN